MSRKKVLGMGLAWALVAAAGLQSAHAGTLIPGAPRDGVAVGSSTLNVDSGQTVVLPVGTKSGYVAIYNGTTLTEVALFLPQVMNATATTVTLVVDKAGVTNADLAPYGVTLAMVMSDGRTQSIMQTGQTTTYVATNPNLTNLSAGFTNTMTYNFTAVPEPSAVVLAGLGGVAVIGAGLRRRRSLVNLA